MSADTTREAALLRLGASSAEAVAQVLDMFAPGAVTRGEVKAITNDDDPFGKIEPGTVAAGVSYVDGVTGGNVFLAPPETVRLLAAAMGAGEDLAEDEPLSELELSAMSEASNQMMASAASAIGVVLGQEIEISPPVSGTLQSPADAEGLFGSAPFATSTTFLVSGGPCRLVQLVPSAFVTRISQAMDALEEPVSTEPRAPAGSPVELEEALSEIDLRVWAELGRTRLPLGETLKLPLGAIVELDRATEAPVDLYVNGLRFAQGHLLVDDDGRWAIALDELDRPLTLPALGTLTPC